MSTQSNQSTRPGADGSAQADGSEGVDVGLRQGVCDAQCLAEGGIHRAGPEGARSSQVGASHTAAVQPGYHPVAQVANGAVLGDNWGPSSLGPWAELSGS